jgi:hypothetical protein
MGTLCVHWKENKEAKFIYSALGKKNVFISLTVYLQVADLIVLKSVLVL